jgi:ATP-dependent Clp protease ATP-binding subunit ClpC
MNPEINFNKFSLKEIPDEFRTLMEDASFVSKRIDKNLIGFGHVFVAICKKYPDLLSQYINEPDTNKQFDLLMATLRRCAIRVEGHDINVDKNILDIIKKVVSKGSGSSEELLSAFIKETEKTFPDEFNLYFTNQKTDNAKSQIQISVEKATEPATNITEQEEIKKEEVDVRIDTKSVTPSKKKEPADVAVSPQLIRAPFTRIWDRDTLTDAPEKLIGRDGDIKSLLRILLRMKDPAVMLLGEPGCGKTGFLKGLAELSLKGKLPALEKYVFVELDIPNLLNGVSKGVAGTAELTDTLNKIAGQMNVVLIIDDFHSLLAQTGYYMVDDLSSCFKPFLSNGSLRVIFSTTPKLYDRYFSQDTIFANRTSLLYLEEMSDNILKEAIIQAIRPLEKYHQLVISPEAVKTSINITGKHKSHYRPPGSCARLIDDACAIAVFQGNNKVLTEHVEEASRSHAETGLSFDKAILRSFETELKKYIHGQEDAVEAVSRRIRLTKLQLDRKPHRPDGVFLFCGPSGVGKTEVAKACTLSLYGDMNRLVRLDMSEYMSEHEYSKIIGAPPGYVGYGEEGYLTGPVSKLGHAVILLDEIEKAHPKILNIFLQLFDEGFLTDGKGKRVDFSQCVIFMTSNMGQELWEKEPERIGFLNADKGSVTQAKPVLDYMLQYLPSEFVNRIDEIVLFRPLNENNLHEIARRIIEEELDRWRQRGKNISYDDKLLDFVAEQNYNPKLGARHLSRNIEKIVCQPLSDRACHDDWAKIQRIHINVKRDKVEIDFSVA